MLCTIFRTVTFAAVWRWCSALTTLSRVWSCSATLVCSHSRTWAARASSRSRNLCSSCTAKGLATEASRFASNPIHGSDCWSGRLSIRSADVLAASRCNRALFILTDMRRRFSMRISRSEIAAAQSSPIVRGSTVW